MRVDRNKDVIKIYNNALAFLQSGEIPFCGYGRQKDQYKLGVEKGIKNFYSTLGLSEESCMRLKPVKVIKTKEQLEFIDAVLFGLYLFETYIKDYYAKMQIYTDTEHQKLAGMYAGSFFMTRAFVLKTLKNVHNTHLYYNEERS